MKQEKLQKTLVISVIAICTGFVLAAGILQYMQYHNPVKVTGDINKSNQYKYYEISREGFHFVLDSNDEGMWYRTLSGWVFIDNVSIKAYDTRLVLYDETTDIGYAFYTKVMEKPGVTELYGENIYNYDFSGFQTRIDSGYFEEGKVYTLGFLMYDSEEDYQFLLTDYKMEIKNWRDSQ